MQLGCSDATQNDFEMHLENATCASWKENGVMKCASSPFVVMRPNSVWNAPSLSASYEENLSTLPSCFPGCLEV